MEKKLITVMGLQHAQILLVALSVNVLMVTEVMESKNALKSMNVLKALINAMTILQHVPILLSAVTPVIALMATKVMVSNVPILMNVLLMLTLVTNSAFVPIPQAHTTVRAMMDTWVTDFCLPFPVQHSMTPHAMVF